MELVDTNCAKNKEAIVSDLSLFAIKFALLLVNLSKGRCVTKLSLYQTASLSQVPNHSICQLVTRNSCGASSVNLLYSIKCITRKFENI